MSAEVRAGRVAVVTGAGAGIGRALAVHLVRDGWCVALLDVDGDAVQATSQDVSVPGAEVLSSAADVSQATQMADFANDVQDRFGRVDAVFCVAGVIHTGDVLSTDPADFEHVLRVNTLGSFNTAKAFLPLLISSSGQLVFVSSAFGLLAAPNYSAYCASKFAVRALAESLQQEMALAGHDVKVACVYPGGVRTDIMRRGRYAAGVDRAAVQDSFDTRIARTTADAAAATILEEVRRGRRRIYVGRDAHLVAALVRLVGPRYPQLVSRVVRASRSLSSLSERRRWRP